MFIPALNTQSLFVYMYGEATMALKEGDGQEDM